MTPYLTRPTSGLQLYGHGDDVSHPTRIPIHQTGIKLGDYQFERADKWKNKGILALLGLGVEPGMADVFAQYAAPTSLMRSTRSASAMVPT